MLASYGLHAGLFRAKFHACTPNRLIDWLIDFSADPLLPPLSHLIFPLSIRSWPVANQNLTGFIRRRHSRAEFATISRKNRRQSGRRFVWPAASYCEKRNEPAGNWERDGIRRWDTRNSQDILSGLFWSPGFPRLDRIISINLVSELTLISILTFF